MVSEFRRPVRPELVDNQTEARMGKVRVAGFGVSIDGFGAGPDQGPGASARQTGPRIDELVLPDPGLSIDDRKGRRD
jgi:hypothetical protein